jgi:uncharacterized protein involved in exopolysaccharide biosynthesis
MLNERLESLDWQKKHLKRILKLIQSATDRLINEYNLLSEKEGQINNEAFLRYINDIQQDIISYREVEETLNSLDQKREIVLNDIESLEKEIEHLRAEIGELKLKRDDIHNIRLVQEAEVSPHPIKPKRKLSIVTTGIVSLMFGIFLAFFQEFWKDYTHK